MKLKSNAIEPENNGVYLALNHHGFLSLVKFDDGVWFKLTSRDIKQAERDEKFDWIDMGDHEAKK